LRRGENRSTRGKTSRSKDENQQKTQPAGHVMTPGPGVEPRPYWWEASALTTAPPLLPDPDYARPNQLFVVAFFNFVVMES